jgi:hypothetical protein
MQGCRLLPAGALTVALIAAPASADARKPALPSSTVAGVSVAHRGGDSVVIRFSRSRAARRAFSLLEGRRVRVTCSDFTGSGAVIRGHTQLDLPRHFTLIRLNGLDHGYEVCSLSRPGLHRIVVLALDQAGREFLGDARAVATVRGVATALRGLAKADADHHYPAAKSFVDRDRGRYAVLARPREDAPRGRIGIYSDGDHHASVVMSSPSGRQFFYEIDGASVKTNVTAVEGRFNRLDA